MEQSIRAADYQQIGSAGDLRIQSLVAIRAVGQTQVWVVGYFHNQTNHCLMPDAEMYQIGLSVLVWRLARMEVAATWARATASLRTALQSIARRPHQKSRPGI